MKIWEHEHVSSEHITEIDGYRLTTSSLGASLRGLSHTSQDSEYSVVTGYHGDDGKVGGQGDVLIPFPGRIRAGHYSFEGQEYQLDKNDKEGPNAIHGFVRTKLWTVTHQSHSSIGYAVELDADEVVGYPFSLRCTVAYELSADGLKITFAITNTGKSSAPVGAGFHPYFTAGSELINTDLLTLPFRKYLEFDGLLPTGKVLPVEGSPFDFRTERLIGTTVFNTCYCDPELDVSGRATVRLRNPITTRALEVWSDQTFGYTVLYSGDPLPDSHRRRSLAIEPMTCGSDAFNHPSWGLVVLAPEETLRAEWGVRSLRA